jgi:four helix bundle protein
MRNYKDLRVWDEAHRLTLAVYKVTQTFPKEERFGLTSQIRRASASIAANLAEGCDDGRTEKWAGSSRLQWAQERSFRTICF